MNCSELIAWLRAFPHDARVVMDGYEGGFIDVNELDLVNIKADANPDVDCYGSHLIDDKGPTTEAAVWIQAAQLGTTLEDQRLSRVAIHVSLGNTQAKAKCR